jgi:excisionase family DNA binding protein
MSSEEINKDGKPGKPTALQLLTKKEVARLLACSIRMVERLVASGTLTTVKIRGAVRFRLSDVEQIILKGAA